MIRELKAQYSYTKAMLTLSLASLISGAAFSVLGEIFLPFATAFFAALIHFEKPKGRFLSYLVPAFNLVIALLVNGLYGFVTIEYVLLAVILVLVYYRMGSKAECALYMTLITAVFVILSLYLGAVMSTGDFSFAAVSEYYSQIYSSIKEKTAEYLLSLEVSAEESAMITEEAIEQYFDLLANAAVSVVGIIAFLITGISIKLFIALCLRYGENGIYKTFVHFMPSSFVAYTYLAIAIIYLLSDSSSVFSLAIFNAYEMLMVVFAYVGARFVYILGKLQGKRTLTLVMIAGFVFATGLTVQILSYIGIWIALNTRKSIETSSEKQ